MKRSKRRAIQPPPPNATGAIGAPDRRDLLTTVALGLLFIAVDAFVLPRDILNYRDSLECVTTSWGLWPAHEPGHPFFVFLSKALAWLLPNSWSLYHRYAFVNSLYGVLALLVFHACLRRLGADRLWSALATLGLGWCYTFWLYRLVPEVFTIGNLAGLCSLWLLLRWRETSTDGSWGSPWRWCGFCLSLGVGWVCHSITLVWWPAFAFAVMVTVKPRRWLPMIALGLIPLAAGFSTALLVWPLGVAPHPPLWGLVATRSSLIDFLLRRDYGGPQNAGRIATQGQFQLGCFTEYLKQLWYNFGLATVPLAAAAAASFRRGKASSALPLIALAVAGPVFVIFGQFRTDGPFYLGSAEPLYLPSLFAAFLAVGLGAARATEGSSDIGRRLTAGLAGALILAELVTNFPRVDRHDHALSKDFSRSLLGRLPPKAVLIVTDDKDLFAAVYEAWGLNRRPDLALINYGFIHKPDYRTELIRAYPDLLFDEALTPSLFMRRFLRDNVGRRPIFFATLKQADLWGIYGDPYFLRPEGKVFEVVTSREAAADAPAILPFSEQLGGKEIEERDFWDLDLLVGYRRSWLNLGEVNERLGLTDRARILYKQIAQIDPGDPEWREHLAALDHPTPPPPVPKTSAELQAAGMAHVKAGQQEEALYDFERAIAVDPNNAKLIDNLAVVLSAQHDTKEALHYARRAAGLEPTNQKYAMDVAIFEATPVER